MMAGIQNFRIAVRGFHRKDVVDYIEYINNKHNAQVEQLNNQLQEALAKSGDTELQAKLEAAEARIKELEEAAAAGAPAATVSCTEQELEAYRRAEKAERQAKERAQQVCDQANAVLAEVTAKAEAASAQISAIADQMQDTKAAIQAAVATLSATGAETEE